MVTEKMKDINQLMDTVHAKWELAYTEWQTQIMSIKEIEAINENFNENSLHSERSKMFLKSK